MNVKEAIEKRRAYRNLGASEITSGLMQDLAGHAGLAPSCFNNQPWRFVFVYQPETLEKLFTALSKGNAWAQKASMIIAVTSRADLDCRVKGRDYYQFDTGMAVGFLLLRARELDLVCHPIAGYDETMVKEILAIPENMTVITLVIAGKKSEETNPLLSEKQVEAEKNRPPRKIIEDFAFSNHFKE